MSGYVKLWRRLKEHQLWKQHRVFSELEAWIYMIIEANWDERTDVTGEPIERGSFCTSVRKLAHDWRWSRGKVQRFLARLARETQIDHKPRHDRTYITIVNYEKYQAVSDEPSQDAGRRRTTKRDTNGAQHKKEEYKKEEIPSLTLPSEIDTFEVRSALQRWLSHKAERRQSYKTTGLRMLIAQLAKLSPERIVSAIDWSISQNYSGIFEQRASSTPARAKVDASRAALARELMREEA